MIPLLLIDGDNLMHRCCYVQRDAILPNGTYVGGIYGALATLRSLVKRYPDHTPILFWDDRSAGRNRFFPAYKSNREKNEFRLLIDRQINRARSFFRLLGFRSAFVPGFEADDLIARVAKMNHCTILSSDKDFLQLLLLPWIRVDRANVRIVLDGASFQAYMGVDACTFRIGQALSGDAKDGIPGVEGVGEMKPGKGGAAKSLLTDAPAELFNNPSAPRWDVFVDHLEGIKSKAATRVLGSFDTVIRNYTLTELFTNRFAPACVASILRDQIVTSYRGEHFGEALEFLYEKGFPMLTGAELLSITYTLADRRNDVEEIRFETEE